MDIMQAVSKRISCRAFDPHDVEPGLLDQLEACIAKGNEAGGLDMRLVRPQDGGAGLKLAGAMFSGQPSAYVVAFAPADEQSRDRLGYYSEKVILLATQLELGTCWVAGTYDKSSVTAQPKAGHKLHGVIPVGYPAAKTPLKQRTVRAALRKRSKKPTELYAGYETAPAWVRAGVDAVIAGPSAANGMPVVFEDTADGIAATLPKVKSGIELIDLGIAKLHFELGAKDAGTEGSWSWGAGGVFTPRQ
jgi:hypothetical protein